MLTIENKHKLNKEFLLTLLVSVIPLLSLCLFSMVSKFNLDENANYSVTRYIFLILSFISIPLLGFQSRTTTKFDIKKALKTIYVMIALWMVINLFITLIQFGPFYTFIYKDRFFFDYGHIGSTPINQMAYMLLGFKVERVSVELFALIASVLSSAILGIFFVALKEDKSSFITYLATGSIGLLCLLLTINKSLLIGYVTLIVGFALIILFAKKIIPFNKITKIVIISIVSLIGIYFLLVMLSGFNILNLEENAFFVNKLTRKYHNFIRTMVEHNVYNGFTPYLIGEDRMKFTGSWMFDLFAISTVFGWISFIGFVVVLFIRYKKYFKDSQNDTSSKILLLGIILSTLLFLGTSYKSIVLVESGSYNPMFFLTPFIILVFIFGYIGKNEEEIKL